VLSDTTGNVETSYVTTEATNGSYTDASLTTSNEYNTTIGYRSKATRNKNTRPDTASSDASTAVTSGETKKTASDEEVVSSATSNVETNYVTTEATNGSYTDSSLTTSNEYNTTTEYRSKATR